MIGKLLYTSLVLTLFLGCGAEENSQNTQDIVENINNSSDTNQTEEQNTSNETQTNSQISNVSLNSCINQTLSSQEVTMDTLTTLSCANLTSRDFNLLNTLPALTELSIIDTPLTENDVENIGNSLNKAQITFLVLENDDLTKRSADKIDPLWNNSYGAEHYPNVKHLSFKNNQIEGLLVVDYFPALETLDLSGNIYPSNRLHHIGFVDALKTLNIAGNPNILTLDDLSDGPSAEASVAHIDISNMPNLADISELAAFVRLQTVTIDNTQMTRFITTLSSLQTRGVSVIVR